MKIDVNKNGNVLNISPFGRLDTSTSPELQVVVTDNIDGVTDLTFDLKQLVQRHIASQAIAVAVDPAGHDLADLRQGDQFGRVGGIERKRLGLGLRRRFLFLLGLIILRGEGSI